MINLVVIAHADVADERMAQVKVKTTTILVRGDKIHRIKMRKKIFADLLYALVNFFRGNLPCSLPQVNGFLMDSFILK